MKKKKIMPFGFSIMELVISFVIVAILMGATTPVLFKKSSKMKLKNLNSVTTTCNPANASCNSYGNRCQLFKKRIENGQTKYTCVLCKPSFIAACKFSNKYFDNETCECLSCSVFDSKVSPTCTNCCIRCNKNYCTGCAKGAGLESRTAAMGCKKCQKGYYSDNSNGADEKCKKCPEGYYCPDDGMDNGKKYKCPIGSYCPEGSINPTKCPAGCYCPEEKMGKLAATTVANLQCPTGINNKTYPCTAGCFCPVGMGNLKQVSSAIVGRTLSCPSGPDGATHPCPKNYYCPTGSKTGTANSCTAWRANTATKYQGANNTTYCLCKEGLYLLNGVCSKCAAGTYKTTIGNEKTLCLECGVGTYNSNSGSASTDACKQCDVGTYQDEKGKTSCKSCDVGTYQDEKGKTSCKECETGYYQDKLGQKLCHECPAGHECSNKTKATPCDYGYYQRWTKQTSCSKCVDHATTAYKGSTSVYDCECIDGYTTDNITYMCCKKIKGNCIPGTTKIITDSLGCSAICMSNRNAGDGGYGSLDGIETLTARTTAIVESFPPYTEYYGPEEWYLPEGSPAVKRCWKGNTSWYPEDSPMVDRDGVTHTGIGKILCNDKDGYSGCTRTVCTREAAKSICANIGPNWRLLKGREFHPIGEDYTKNLKLCVNNESDAVGVSWCGGSWNCPYAYSGTCDPYIIWAGEEDYTALSPSGSYLYLYITSGVDKNAAASVRCVYSLEE